MLASTEIMASQPRWQSGRRNPQTSPGLPPILLPVLAKTQQRRGLRNTKHNNRHSSALVTASSGLRSAFSLPKSIDKPRGNVAQGRVPRSGGSPAMFWLSSDVSFVSTNSLAHVTTQEKSGDGRSLAQTARPLVCQSVRWKLLFAVPSPLPARRCQFSWREQHQEQA